MENVFENFIDYKIVKIEDSNIGQVFNLCKQNKKYYEYLQEKASLDGVKSIINELPPNTTIDKKYFVGFYKANRLVAILDLIDGYPDENNAFIGLFMIDVNCQGKGVGQDIIKNILNSLKNNNYSGVGLGVIDKNKEALSFWKKMGFEKTGQIYNHEKYNVIMLNYNLQKNGEN